MSCSPFTPATHWNQVRELHASGPAAYEVHPLGNLALRLGVGRVERGQLARGREAARVCASARAGNMPHMRACTCGMSCGMCVRHVHAGATHLMSPMLLLNTSDSLLSVLAACWVLAAPDPRAEPAPLPAPRGDSRGMGLWVASFAALGVPPPPSDRRRTGVLGAWPLGLLVLAPSSMPAPMFGEAGYIRFDCSTAAPSKRVAAL